MNLIGDPEAIRAAARVYAQRASQLASVGREAASVATRAEWEAPRADRFRAAVRAVDADAQRRAGELMHISQDLVRIAARVQAQLDSIHRFERLVRSAIALYQPVEGAPAPWVAAGWSPGRLPAAGDPSWERLARSLGIR